MGNPLRGDDGAAAAVLRLIENAPSSELRTVHQLTPELAADLSAFDRVVFLDADARATTLAIEPVPAAIARPTLTHVSAAAEIVALARALFGFTGEALLCRIPAHEFTPGETISSDTAQFVKQAARQIETCL